MKVEDDATRWKRQLTQLGRTIEKTRVRSRLFDPPESRGAEWRERSGNRCYYEHIPSGAASVQDRITAWKSTSSGSSPVTGQKKSSRTPAYKQRLSPICGYARKPEVKIADLHKKLFSILSAEGEYAALWLDLLEALDLPIEGFALLQQAALKIKPGTKSLKKRLRIAVLGKIGSKADLIRESKHKGTKKAGLTDKDAGTNPKSGSYPRNLSADEHFHRKGRGRGPDDFDRQDGVFDAPSGSSRTLDDLLQGEYRRRRDGEEAPDEVIPERDYTGPAFRVLKRDLPPGKKLKRFNDLDHQFYFTEIDGLQWCPLHSNPDSRLKSDDTWELTWPWPSALLRGVPCDVTALRRKQAFQPCGRKCLECFTVFQCDRAEMHLCKTCWKDEEIRKQHCAKTQDPATWDRPLNVGIPLYRQELFYETTTRQAQVCGTGLLRRNQDNRWFTRPSVLKADNDRILYTFTVAHKQDCTGQFETWPSHGARQKSPDDVLHVPGLFFEAKVLCKNFVPVGPLDYVSPDERVLTQPAKEFSLGDPKTPPEKYLESWLAWGTAPFWGFDPGSHIGGEACEGIDIIEHLDKLPRWIEKDSPQLQAVYSSCGGFDRYQALYRGDLVRFDKRGEFDKDDDGHRLAIRKDGRLARDARKVILIPRGLCKMNESGRHRLLRYMDWGVRKRELKDDKLAIYLSTWHVILNFQASVIGNDFGYPPHAGQPSKSHKISRQETIENAGRFFTSPALLKEPFVKGQALSLAARAVRKREPPAVNPRTVQLACPHCFLANLQRAGLRAAGVFKQPTAGVVCPHCGWKLNQVEDSDSLWESRLPQMSSPSWRKRYPWSIWDQPQGGHGIMPPVHKRQFWAVSDMWGRRHPERRIALWESEDTFGIRLDGALLKRRDRERIFSLDSNTLFVPVWNRNQHGEVWVTFQPMGRSRLNTIAAIPKDWQKGAKYRPWTMAQQLPICREKRFSLEQAGWLGCYFEQPSDGVFPNA